jgi:hypothetical protein
MKENISFDELVRRVLEIMPNAVFSEDECGEIVISTGFSAPDKNQNTPLKDVVEE